MALVPLDPQQIAEARHWAAQLGVPEADVIAEAQEAKDQGYREARPRTPRSGVHGPDRHGGRRPDVPRRRPGGRDRGDAGRGGGRLMSGWDLYQAWVGVPDGPAPGRDVLRPGASRCTARTPTRTCRRARPRGRPSTTPTWRTSSTATRWRRSGWTPTLPRGRQLGRPGTTSSSADVQAAPDGPEPVRGGAAGRAGAGGRAHGTRAGGAGHGAAADRPPAPSVSWTSPPSRPRVRG